MKKTILATHGDSSSKRAISIQGHMFNHTTGCIDSIGSNGLVISSTQIMAPQDIKGTLIVGSTSKIDYQYSNPRKWENNFKIWNPKKK